MLSNPAIADVFFSSRSRHTRLVGDWSSDVCSSDLLRKQRMYRHERPADNFLIRADTRLDRIVRGEPLDVEPTAQRRKSSEQSAPRTPVFEACPGDLNSVVSPGGGQ